LPAKRPDASKLIVSRDKKRSRFAEDPQLLLIVLALRAREMSARSLQIPLICASRLFHDEDEVGSDCIYGCLFNRKERINNYQL
jgi:hypothetical protein